MKEEFDLDKIGKQMPYKVPSGFFKEITEDTLSKVEERTASKGKSLWRWTPIAASIILLLLAGYFSYQQSTGEHEMKSPVAQKETPAVAVPGPALSQAPPVVAQSPTVPAPAISQNTKEQHTVPTHHADQEVSHIQKQETLDDILANLTDEELLELAALAETELYVYEETLGNEKHY